MSGEQTPPAIERVQPPMDMDTPTPTPHEASAALRTLIRYLGDDPDRPGLRDTPARVLRLYDELRQTRTEPLRLTTFPSDSHGLTVVADIAFFSLCEHHLLSYSGRTHIGYLPNGVVLGLSKLPRIVQQQAAGLTIQETLTASIAGAISEAATTRHVAVVLEAQHTCAQSRGVRALGSTMRTSDMRGAFLEQPSLRSEFLSMAGLT